MCISYRVLQGIYKIDSDFFIGSSDRTRRCIAFDPDACARSSSSGAGAGGRAVDKSDQGV